MKNISLLALAVVAAMTATAQPNVVKDAERAMKAGDPADKVAEIIKPALTDPATAQNAQTWYIPGKAAFGDRKSVV